MEKDEIVARIMGLLPPPNGAGAELYHQFAELTVTWVVDAMEATGRRFTWRDLNALLEDRSLLVRLLRDMPKRRAKSLSGLVRVTTGVERLRLGREVATPAQRRADRLWWEKNKGLTSRMTLRLGAELDSEIMRESA